MEFPRDIYAIYPYDENGTIAGVYVGSSAEVIRRINNHRTSKDGNELHTFMRNYGFTFQILGTIKGIHEKCLEYDWIDFFEKRGVKVFNALTKAHYPKQERLFGATIPVWTGKAVVWELK